MTRIPIPWLPVAMLAVSAILACAQFGSFAADPPNDLSLETIHRVDVPEDRLADAPDRDSGWTPVPRAEFERLLKPLLPQPAGPAGAELHDVSYTAVLIGDTLSEGRLRAAVQNFSNGSRYLDLGQPSIAVEELSWSDRPALWGTAPDGKHWLKLHHAERNLVGRWSARGRTLESGIAFDLSFLPAAISCLELQTPAGRTVTSDVGDVQLMEPGAEGRLARWQIDLGDSPRCRLIVSPEEPKSNGSPIMLYEQELSVAVANDELTLQQLLKVEVLEGEADRLIVSFPRQVEIASASYGNQTPLKFERIPIEGPAAHLVLHLPNRLRGRSREIRLEGFLRRSASETVSLPQFQIEGGLWLEGRLNVLLARPWELRSYRATGYRQTAPATVRTEAETLSFQQLTPRSQLLLNVERPAVERSAHALNILSMTDSGWTLTAEIAWESRNGTVFDATCRLPDGWQVVSVVQLGGGRELEELNSWDVQAHAESGQVLEIELPEGLTPGRVDPVRVVAHRIATTSLPTQVPLIVPTDCETSEVLLEMDAKLSELLPLEGNAAWEPFDPQTAAAVWNTLPAWSEAQRNQPDAPRLLHLLSPEPVIPLSGESRRRNFEATVQVNIEITADDVQEQFEIRCSAAEPLAQLEVLLPSDGENTAWSLADDAGTPIAAERMSQPPGLPSTIASAMGAWRLSIPATVNGPVTVIGRRTSPRNGRYVIPLLLAPQAQRFQGMVRLSVPAGDDLEIVEVSKQVSPQAVPQTPVAESLRDTPREWTYRSADREWIVQPRRLTADSFPPLQYRLTSILAADAVGSDYHQLTLLPEDAPAWSELRFQLDAPAEMVAVVQGDRQLPFIAEGTEIAVSGGESKSTEAIRILYRVPNGSEFCRMRHRFIVPRFSAPGVGLTWDVCLPPEGHFYGKPLGLAMSPSPSSPNWWQRVLGPLSRAPGEPWLPSAPEWFSNSAHVETANHSGTTNSAALSGLTFPAGWTVYRAADRFIPAETTYYVWDRSAVRLASWAAMLGILPLGLVLRGKRSSWRSRLAALLIAAFIAIAIFGPEGWNVIAGGASSGLLLACVLPVGVWPWVRKPSGGLVDPSTRTEIFRQAAFPCVLWLAAAGAVSWVAAQEQPLTLEDGAPLAAADKNPPPRYRILVPVDAEGKPSQKLPVVYVSPELFEKLNAMDAKPPAAPAQLIQSAEYIVHTDPNRRPILNIIYQVDRLTAGNRRELLIPLSRRWQAGLENCRIDGRSEPAVSVGDGDMLAVSLPELQAEGPADAAEFPDRHEVALEVRLPAEVAGPDGRLVADVLPILNSRLIWHSPAGLRWFDLREAKGLVTASLDRHLVEAQLGAVSEFQFRQADDEHFWREEAATDTHWLQLLTLRPTLVQGDFRAVCRVIDGGINRLQIDLPVGAALREIRGHKILKTTVISSPGAVPKIVVEFQEPLTQDFVVEGEYILPRTSSDQTIEYPQLSVRCGKPTSTPRNLIAVACGPDYSAQMINLDDPTILPIQLEQFVSQWGDTVPTQRPQFAFQLQDGGRPAFRLVAGQPEVHLLNWQEDVTVTRRRLDWNLSAELKPSSPAIFSYSVLLDRRLTIEEVSVRENGVDQKLRWSKTPMIGSSQSRITVFLNRETTGVSLLKIRGSLRMRPSSPVALPSIRFETAETVPGTLTLFHEAGHRLELDGRQQPVDDGAAAPPANSGESVPVRFLKRFKISEGDAGLTARLEPLAGPCRVQMLWGVIPEDNGWRIRGWWELAPQPGTREISIAVPEWMKLSQVTVLDEGPSPSESMDDGERRWQVKCNEDGSSPRTLAVDAELTEPERVVWRLVLPTVRKAVESNVYAAVTPQAKWAVAEGTPVPLAAFPAAIRDRWTERQIGDIETVSRVTNDTLVLERQDSGSSGTVSSAVLVDHLLMATSDGGWSGQSDFYPNVTDKAMELSLPAGLERISLLADEAPFPITAAETSAGRIHVPDAGRFRTISLRWKLSLSADSNGPIAVDAVPLPTCLHAEPAVVFVTIRPTGDGWRIVPRALQHRSGWEMSCKRLETLLKRYRQQHTDASNDPALRRAIWREYRIAASELSIRDVGSRMTDEDRRRWEALSSEMSQIEDPGQTADSQSIDDGLTASASDDGGTLSGRLPANASEFRCWRIRSELIDGGAAAGLLLAGWWLLPAVVAVQFAPWLQRRRYAGWFVFGLAWWWCWSPGILGLAMMAWAVAKGFWQRHPRVVVNQ